MYGDNWAPIPNIYEPIANGSIDGFGKIPHDKAVIRALNAFYKPNKLVIGEPLCTIFVARLDYSTNESMLNDAFSKYGKIIHLRLVRDIITGFSKQYAFIEYSNQENAKKAIRGLHNTTLDGKRILVTTECERTLNGWVPRRLGGGFGGKKEAGQLRFGCIDRPFKRTVIAKKHSRGVSKIEPDNYTRNLLLTNECNNDSSKDRYLQSLSIGKDSANDYSKGKFPKDSLLHNDCPDEYLKNKHSKKLSHNKEFNYKLNNSEKRKINTDYQRDSSTDSDKSQNKFNRRDIKKSSYSNDYRKSRHTSRNKEPKNILDISPSASHNIYTSKKSRTGDYKNRRRENDNSYMKHDMLNHCYNNRHRDSRRLRGKSRSRDSEHLEERIKNTKSRQFKLYKEENIKVENIKTENIKIEDL